MLDNERKQEYSIEEYFEYNGKIKTFLLRIIAITVQWYHIWGFHMCCTWGLEFNTEMHNLQCLPWQRNTNITWIWTKIYEYSPCTWGELCDPLFFFYYILMYLHTKARVTNYSNVILRLQDKKGKSKSPQS